MVTDLAVLEVAHMTQHEALEAARALFPDDAQYLSVSRERFIGNQQWDRFYLWRHLGGRAEILASSTRSFEHALAIARSGNEDCWEQDDSPLEQEAL